MRTPGTFEWNRGKPTLCRGIKFEPITVTFTGETAPHELESLTQFYAGDESVSLMIEFAGIPIPATLPRDLVQNLVKTSRMHTILCSEDNGATYTTSFATVESPFRQGDTVCKEDFQQAA